jgi:hypothetical protein
MSSSKFEDELVALRSKVAQLEAKQKIQRMGQKMEQELMRMQQAMDKRDRETEKKGLEMKTTFEKMEAALGNEKRTQEAALENERRERQAEKKEMMVVLENEKKERQAEKKEMMAVLENEKRDRLLEEERRERQAEKKEMMVVLENEKKERQAEKKEMMVMLEKNEMMVALEKHKIEHQHQIEQLKSEARISHMEQQLLEMRKYTSLGIPTSRATIQHPATVYPAPQRETELLLLQRIQQMEKAAGIEPPAIPNEDNPAHLQPPDASYQKSLQPASHKSAVTPHVSKISSQQASMSQISPQQPSKPNEPQAASITPSRSTQHQHQVAAALPQGNTKTAQGRPVPLPSNSDNHFFLSHCQSTGGDQTNAIYLELRQLGFACWYDNRADDLTKEGMRQGIVHAAAFLLFLSKGVLDRPFCK